MISMAIGLIVAGAAFSAYIGTAAAARMAQSQGQMYEDGQAALGILVQQVRMAGSNPDQPGRINDPSPTLASVHNPVYLPAPTYAGYQLSPASFRLSAFSLRGCKGPFPNVAGAGRIDDLLCASGAGPQSLAVSYEADRYNTTPNELGLATDCLGNALGLVTATLPAALGAGIANVEVVYAVADNRFYIGSSASVPGLYCKGAGGVAAQPLVDNIEDLQFMFGVASVASPAATATVAGYLNADDIATQADLAALPDDAARWAKVLTVRICVLVRSELPLVDTLAAARYLKCDGTMETSPPDRRLRRAYSTTVALRNRGS